LSSWPFCVSRAALNLTMLSPSSPAYFSYVSRSMCCWSAKILSCISQYLPWSPAARAAIAAGIALGWKGSGRSRHATRTLPLYSVITWLIVGSTRLQNGHWKSENCTIVTFASLAGLVGAHLTSALKRVLSSGCRGGGGGA